MSDGLFFSHVRARDAWGTRNGNVAYLRAYTHATHAHSALNLAGMAHALGLGFSGRFWPVFFGVGWLGKKNYLTVIIDFFKKNLTCFFVFDTLEESRQHGNSGRTAEAKRD
jgi:hypothetical protein